MRDKGCAHGIFSGKLIQKSGTPLGCRVFAYGLKRFEALTLKRGAFFERSGSSCEASREAANFAGVRIPYSVPSKKPLLSTGQKRFLVVQHVALWYNPPDKSELMRIEYGQAGNPELLI